MPSIDIRRTHNKSMKDARVAVDHIADRIAEKFDVACGWSGNTLEFNRSGVHGEIKLSKGEVHIIANLSFLLLALKGPIESEIHRYLDTEFA